MGVPAGFGQRSVVLVPPDGRDGVALDMAGQGDVLSVLEHRLVLRNGDLKLHQINCQLLVCPKYY